MDPSPFAAPGPLTVLTGRRAAAVRALPGDAEALARVTQGLVLDAGDPFGTTLSPERSAERSTRPVDVLLEQLLALDDAPLDVPRPPERRVVGTCRHVAVVATALLRAHGIPARARCGFAMYFVPDRAVDHWVVEHWSAAPARWVRVDPEVIDLGLVADPFDLDTEAFLTGGEAWRAVRSGDADPDSFGVAGTENWGPGEIRGNLLRDLAAWHRVEVLPWDEWGPMAASYAGETDARFDEELDDLAAALASEDGPRLAAAWARYAVPDHLIG